LPQAVCCLHAGFRFLMKLGGLPSSRLPM
jgi:hypothetical protein